MKRALPIFLVGLCFCVPLLWVAMTAFKSEQQLQSSPLSLWPSPIRPDNFQQAIQLVPMHRYTLNTLGLALLVSLGHLFSCPLAAYALVKLKNRLGKSLRILTVAAFVIPYPALMVPQFLLFQKLGLINSYWPLIIPAFLGNPLYILYLMRVFQAFPRELEEAAILDGASPWTILSQIIMPLSRPALAAMLALTVQSVWNDFLGPLLYLQDPRLYTVNLGLQFYRGSHHVQWNLLMAATLMAVLPVFILFGLAQRSFMGLSLTGAGK
ncbi:MAG: carbohydrate ABC transporter permease [Vulcanimicrobiota bacterium]